VRPARACGAPGCREKHWAKGLCSRHYSEEVRRRAGVAERGPTKQHRIEFVVGEALYFRFVATVSEGSRSDVLRAALEAWMTKHDG
jgi:hypothetical protein